MVFFVETPKAIQHVFLFPFYNFPRFQDYSVSFLPESAKVCQSYFYLCLQTRFALADRSEDYKEIVQRSVMAAVSAGKTHGFCNPSCARCRGGVRRRSAFVRLRRGKHVRHSDGVVPWRVCHYSGIRIRLRANPHAADCKYGFTKDTQPGSVDPGCAMNYHLPTATLRSGRRSWTRPWRRV